MKPKLRFKGYDQDWEKHDLSDNEFIIQAGGDVDISKIKDKGKYPVIANALSHAGIVGFYDDSYRIAAPAVTITGRGDIGVAVARKENFTPVVRLLALKSPHNVDFIACAINNHPKYLESTGVPQLTVPKLKSYRIGLPSIEEQNIIGDFVQKYDILITKSESEISRLKQVKQASLQSMFPQPGETKPKLRFNGFSDDWKEVSIAEDLELHRGLTYRPCDICTPSEGYLVLRSSNINNDTLTTNKDDVYVKKEAIKIPLIDEGDLLFTAANGSLHLVGKHCIIKDLKSPAVAGGFMLSGKSKNTDFTQAWLSAPWFKKALPSFIAGGNGALGNLKASDFLNTKAKYPSDSRERDAIGAYFSELDAQISLLMKKLEKLKQVKAACLSQMFV